MLKVSEFIGVKAEYDQYGGQQIWGVNKSGRLQHILDVRGWELYKI